MKDLFSAMLTVKFVMEMKVIISGVFSTEYLLLEILARVTVLGMTVFLCLELHYFITFSMM